MTSDRNVKACLSLNLTGPKFFAACFEFFPMCLLDYLVDLRNLTCQFRNTRTAVLKHTSMLLCEPATLIAHVLVFVPQTSHFLNFDVILLHPQLTGRAQSGSQVLFACLCADLVVFAFAGNVSIASLNLSLMLNPVAFYQASFPFSLLVISSCGGKRRPLKHLQSILLWAT